MNRKKICFVVAAPTSADGFLTEQIILLRKEYDVYLAANGEYGEEWKKVDINDFYSFPIMRQISLWKDLKSVWYLYRYFRRMGFDAVHSLTPKAGLVCALAAFFARVYCPEILMGVSVEGEVEDMQPSRPQKAPDPFKTEVIE